MAEYQRGGSFFGIRSLGASFAGQQDTYLNV